MNTWLYIVLILILQPNDKGREGNKAYDRGDYALAAQLYTEAINKEPENSKLYFNLGNALSKLGKKAEANEAWEKAKTINKNPLDQSKSYYNQGFAASQENDYEKAATLYKNALRLNPKDEDAKHNLELVTKKQQQQKQQQQQQQPQQNQQDQQKNQQQQQQQQNQQQQNQQQQNQQQQQQENKQQSPSKPQFDPGSMSKQQAKDMLDALESQEKDLLKNIKKRKASSNKNAKDW